LEEIKKVYNYNSEGYLTHISELDYSDKCQITGEWLIPAQATEKEPLTKKEGFEVKFTVSEWEYEKILTEEEKKIQGLLSLEEGEKKVDGTIVKVESPSELYSWSYDTKEWYLDEEKVRISKIPTAEELEKTRIELVVLDLITTMKEEGTL